MFKIVRKPSQPIEDHPLWPRPLLVVSSFVRHSYIYTHIIYIHTIYITCIYSIYITCILYIYVYNIYIYVYLWGFPPNISGDAFLLFSFRIIFAGSVALGSAMAAGRTPMQGA